MESDHMNNQKQRKIIMKVNGEKQEILFHDNDKGGECKKNSSKRKSSDRSPSPSKRKKSCDKKSSSSKDRSLKENKSDNGSTKELEQKNIEKSSSSSKIKTPAGSSNKKSSEKSSNQKSSARSSPEFLDQKFSEKSSSRNSKNNSPEKSTSTSKKSSSEQKSNSTEQKSDKKEKSSNKNDSTSEKKDPKDRSSSSKHRSSSSSSKQSSSSKRSSVSKSDKSISKSASESKQNSPEKSTSKHQSELSSKSKGNNVDKSSLKEDPTSKEHKSSSSKSKSNKSSSSSSKRSKSSEKSSSSQSKRSKASDESKTENKEANCFTIEQMEFLNKEFQKIRDENKKVLENFQRIQVQLLEHTYKFTLERELNINCSCDSGPEIPKFVDDPENPIYPTDIDKRLAIINAQPVEHYPDEDYADIFIDGKLVPKCKFEYFIDPVEKVLKFRKIADLGHLAENPFIMKCTKCNGGSSNIPKMNENAKESEVTSENDNKLIPNTEIPLQEIANIQQSNSNEKIKMVSIKTEAIDDNEVSTSPVSIFMASTGTNISDSKANVRLNEIKQEPQPHCSKDIPQGLIKQELSIDSEQYFRLIPQNSTNSEIPPVDDKEWLKSMADMTLINKWMASQNRSHGFKDKITLNSMMSEKSLFSLFKCMGINCCYTTISYEHFIDHLNIHMESTSYTKDCYLNCAYCFNKSTNPIDLIQHYKTVHFNCIFQCNLCFYRAAEQQSVYDHQVYFHGQDPRKREILECPIVFPKDEKIEEQKVINKIKSIKDCLSCELCFENFINPEDYIKHLRSSHQSAEEKEISEQKVKKINIDFTKNIIGKYQCLECESTKPYGSNNKIEMRAHLHQHPSTLHFVCVRETDKYKHMRIKSRGDIQVTKYNGDLEVLKNVEGILRITT